jgi:hypothetical protein
MNKLMTIGRAALVAVTLGAASIAAMPAQAAQFTIGLNGGGTFNFGNGNITLQFGQACLTNSQAREGVRNAGYTNVQTVKNLGNNKVVIVGKKNGKWYQMRVNKCTRVVDRIERIYPNNNGSFSITLTF